MKREQGKKQVSILGTITAIVFSPITLPLSLLAAVQMKKLQILQWNSTVEKLKQLRARGELGIKRPCPRDCECSCDGSCHA